MYMYITHIYELSMYMSIFQSEDLNLRNLVAEVSTKEVLRKSKNFFYTYTYTSIYIHIYMHICMYLCIYIQICVNVYIHILYMYIYIY
jgi:hypothetical protein